MVNLKIKVNTRDTVKFLDLTQLNLTKASKELHEKVIKAGQREAKRLAPVDTGILKRNIIVQIFKTRSRLISFIDHKSFPYNLWVEGRIKAIRLFPPFGDGITPIRYGDDSTGYAWTGTPGYMTKAARFMRDRLKQELPKLKVQITGGR